MTTDRPKAGPCPRCGKPMVNRKAHYGRRHTKGTAPDFLIHKHSGLVSCDDRAYDPTNPPERVHK